MADTLTINVRDIRYSDTVHVRIPIINKTNPCFGYDATEDQIRQLMSIPNYEIRDAATGVIINGHNLQEYFPGGGGGGGGVTPAEVKTMIANSIDATVSATSKNAIQNKVIKQYVDDNVDGKVDKVQGKGLSTNDYTTTEKTKLEELADIQSIGDGLSLDNGELSATGGSGGTSDYNDLENQPSINNITLVGNKSLSDLGIAAESDIPTSGADIGLGNVDNTSDLDKPISTATQAALDGKQPTLTTEQLAAMNSGITSADVEQINTNAAILSQTYNSADCNMSIYLCQDNGVGNQSTYYMTDQSKMNFAIRYFGRLVRYWKDGVDYQKFRWSSVGVIATNNSTKKDMLTLDIPEVTNETYVKIFYPTDDVPMDDPDGGYNWRKSSVNVGDVWYIRPHIEYTDLETGMEYTMYGAVYKVTAGVPCTIECDTLSCTELTAREQVNENNILSLMPTAYTAPTMRQDYGLTLVWGGYAKIGNLCIINMRLTCTSDIPHGEFFIQRLPSCVNISALNSGQSFVAMSNNKNLSISCCVTNNSDAPTDFKGAIANTESVTDIPAGTLTISGMYLCS